MATRLFPAIFLIAVLLRIALLIKLGDPFPPGLRSDSNVYLELALNLWRDGSFGTRVSIDYPPAYPMLIAPVFALQANADRFAAIYVLHGLLLAGGALAMLPMLKATVGERSAWLLLAAAQLLFGGMFHGYNPQTETLFAAQLMAATGLVWFTSRHPERALPWLGLGVVCGLAVTTRRAAIVIPAAVGMVWLHDAVRALVRREPFPWRPPVLLLLGAAVGLLPEAVATAMHGAPIDPYVAGKEGRGVAHEHLYAIGAALGGSRGTALLTRISGLHLGYVLLATAGAPVLLATYLWRARRHDEELPLRRAAAFAGYASLGMVALSVMHILRYRLRRRAMDGWDLYPRYVDPAEAMLVVLAAAVAFRLLVDAEPARALRALHGRARRLLPLAPWLAFGALAVWAGGTLDRVRGGRIRGLKHWARSAWGEDGLLLYPVLTIVILVVLAAWWTATRDPRRAARTWALPVAMAVLVSWGISSHSWLPRLTRDAPRDGRTEVLKLVDEHVGPDVPLGVRVVKPGPYGRRYYEPGFRSDHPVYWLRPDEVRAWLLDHPDGVILGHRKDPRPDLPFIHKGEDWRLHSAQGRGKAGGLIPP